MAVQANAVSGPVRQPRNFVSWPKAEIGDHFARGRIHGFACGPRFGRRQGRILRLAFQVPDLALAFGGLAENRGARDIGLVPFHRAAIVHQHHVALAQLLRRYAAVRERRVLAENRHGVSLHAQRAVGRCDIGAQLALRHTLMQGGEHRLITRDRDIAGALHQGQFRGRLDHPAARGYRIGRDQLERRHLFSQPIEDGEADAFLKPQTSGSRAAILQHLGNLPIRPIRIGAALVAGNPGRFALHRQNQSEPAVAPALPGVIVQTRAGLEENRPHFVFAHEPAGLLHARAAFVFGDGLNAVQHGPQFTNRFGHIRLLGTLLGVLLSPGQARRGAAQEGSSVHVYATSVGFFLCHSVTCS